MPAGARFARVGRSCLFIVVYSTVEKEDLATTSSLLRKTLRGVAASLFGNQGLSRKRLSRPSRARRAALEPLESRQMLSLSGWSIGVGSPAGGSGNNAEYGWDTAVDAGGNVYVTGRFEQTVDFDPGPGVVELDEVNGNAFVAKYRADGVLLWAEQTEGRDGRRIAVDGSGNAYVVGTGALKFWKLAADENGWLGAPDVNGLLSATDVAVDVFGDVYLSGSFSGTADFGKPGSSQSISLTSAGGSDIYVAKYDPDGEIIWAERAGAANGSDQATTISLDDSGHVYLTGAFHESADFGTHSLVSLARGTKGRSSREITDDIFVTQLNASDGAFQWATRPVAGETLRPAKASPWTATGPSISQAKSLPRRATPILAAKPLRISSLEQMLSCRSSIRRAASSGHVDSRGSHRVRALETFMRGMLSPTALAVSISREIFVLRPPSVPLG